MATCSQRAATRPGRTKVRQLARQANRRDFCENEPQNLDTDQSPNHSIPDHAQHGQSIYARRELCRGALLGSRRLLEHVDWGNPFLVLERTRRMRRGSCAPETAGIRFRVLAGDDLRQSLLRVHLGWYDDRAGKELRRSEQSDMGRSLAFRRDYEFSHDRPPTSSDDERAAGTIFARVAQESGSTEFESSLVSRAAYRIHYTALLLAVRHSVFCPFRRHELVLDWRDGGCEHRLDRHFLFLSYFYSVSNESAAKVQLSRLGRTPRAPPSITLTAKV